MNIPPKTTTTKKSQEAKQYQQQQQQQQQQNNNVAKKKKQKKKQKQKQKLTPISNLIGGNSMFFIRKRSRTPCSPLERPLFYVPFPPSPTLD